MQTYLIRQIAFVVLAASFAIDAVADTEWVIAPTTPPTNSIASAKLGGAISLDEALSRLQTLKKSPSGNSNLDSIVLRFLPGTYRISNPIVLDAGNHAAQEQHISFAGPADKSAIISGGKVLAHAGHVSDPEVLKRLAPEARNNIVQFDLRAEGITGYGEMVPQGFNQLQLGYGQEELMPGSLELFYRGKPMTLARWPNTVFAKVEGAPPDGASEKRSFHLSTSNLGKLAHERDLMVSGYLAKDWAFESLPVESVDPATGTLWIKQPGPKLGIKNGQRYFIQNALSELDQPGEWYLDRASGILYFWPPAPLNPGDVEVSTAASLLITKGKNNIHVAGMTFEMARGDALNIHGGSGIVIEHSTIRNVGGRAAIVDGSDNHLRDLDVYDTGEGGVYLWGGNRKTLQLSGLSVEDSRFRRYARLSRTYRPAIQLGGVGASAIGNVISDAPHNAIMFFGNDHLIAYNDIFDVAKETGDVGAIYASRDWTARGTVIRNNYLHDIHGPGLQGSRGIYLDDQTSGILVKGNLFVRVDRPVFIGGGRDNVVQHNVMVSSSPAIHVDARGLTWQSAETQSEASGGYRNKLAQVPYDKPLYSDRYPHLAGILNDEPGAPKYNVVKGNLVVGGVPLDIDKPSTKFISAGTQLDPASAHFTNASAPTKGILPSDFSLDANSPALSAGFTQLPLANMDCVIERWRQADLGHQSASCALQ